MIAIKTKLRRWGNSFGIIVPQKAVENTKIKEGDEVSILLKKEEDDNILKEMFGTLKGWKIDAQKIKDELRREEGETERRKWKHLHLTS